MGDTPNEKMSRVRNLIRFPATGKDRRIRLEESRDPRIRFVTKLRFVCGWLLAVGAFCFVLTHYGLFAPSAIQRTVQYALAGARQHEGDITNIEFENNIFSDGALFESGLAYADSDALYLSRPGSMTTFQVTIGYSNPVVESCQTNVLVYDRGGKNAVLTDASSVKAEVALNSAILTGSIGRTGDFLLITDEQGYRTAAAVYSTKGEELFKFSSSELYIVSGGLSPDGRTVAVLGFEQRDASLISHVRFYDVSSGKQISDTELENALGIELCYLDNGSAAVLCDDGLYLVTRRGSSEHALTVGTSDLISVATRDNALTVGTSDLISVATRDNAMVLAIRSYSGGARSDLYTVRGGSVYGPEPLDEEPSALAVSAAGEAVLTSTGVTVYDTQFHALWHNDEAIGARRILLTDDGTVFVLYNSNARIFTARSAQSREVTADAAAANS